MVRPIVMVLAGHEIHHGERDDSEMCLWRTSPTEEVPHGDR